MNEKDMKSYLLSDRDTLASNEFESLDRVTRETGRCHYTRLRGLWRRYYLVISIKNKIHDYLFVDVYGIDREESNWTEAYGVYPVKGMVEQLLLIKTQEKYMNNYYKLPEKKS